MGRLPQRFTHRNALPSAHRRAHRRGGRPYHEDGRTEREMADLLTLRDALANGDRSPADPLFARNAFQVNPAHEARPNEHEQELSPFLRAARQYGALVALV